MKRAARIKKILDKCIAGILGVLVGIISLVVLWQVFTRFILRNPSAWSEEISRYLLIWISFIGGALGLSNGTHMGLVLVTDRIKNPVLKTIVHILAYIVCGAVGFVFVKYGYIYAESGMTRTMMCCNMPMGYVYMIVPVCGVIIIINCIATVFEDVEAIRAERAGAAKE